MRLYRLVVFSTDTQYFMSGRTAPTNTPEPPAVDGIIWDVLLPCGPVGPVRLSLMGFSFQKEKNLS